ncbi:MAG TPA: FHA domain-containing protein [Polyangiaceae bacterium]|nr:FHA domain-containing protein [Polyangiaceae bacterium]
MSSDPNKKSTRSFQCRDVLWETFEQMARELECSVDYLINEAMKQYARQRSYGPGATKTPFPGRAEPSQPGMPSPYGPIPGTVPTNIPTPAVPPPPQMRPPGALPPPPQRLSAPPMRASGGLPSPPRQQQQPPPMGPPPMLGPPPQRGGLPAPPGGAPSRPPPPPMQMGVPQAPRSVPPPIPRGYNGYGAPMQQAQAAPGVLSVIYQNEKIAINKERFVIGRGKQSSDLTLKDPNVSRQHAMVEFQNGVYFMVDMGSTNGVEYNGQRIARKQIAEGDAFRICDHEVRFTYR